MYIQKTKTTYPVTVTEAKMQLRLDTDFNEDDYYIENFLIPTATTIIENLVGFDIAYTTNAIEIEDFVDGAITIYQGNLNSFTSVTDENDNDISYDEIVLPRLVIPNKFKIDFTSVASADPLKINFVTGWEVDNVEKPLKHAILMKVSDLYSEERSNYTFTSHKYTGAIERILKPYILNVY